MIAKLLPGDFLISIIRPFTVALWYLLLPINEGRALLG